MTNDDECAVTSVPYSLAVEDFEWLPEEEQPFTRQEGDLTIDGYEVFATGTSFAECGTQFAVRVPSAEPFSETLVAVGRRLEEGYWQITLEIRNVDGILWNDHDLEILHYFWVVSASHAFELAREVVVQHHAAPRGAKLPLFDQPRDSAHDLLRVTAAFQRAVDRWNAESP
jgi:hypothetical protein